MLDIKPSGTVYDIFVCTWACNRQGSNIEASKIFFMVVVVEALYGKHFGFYNGLLNAVAE